MTNATLDGPGDKLRKSKVSSSALVLESEVLMCVQVTGLCKLRTEWGKGWCFFLHLFTGILLFVGKRSICDAICENLRNVDKTRKVKKDI